ncbi:MAG: protein-L-isoaspartate O-methyltransferase, partial [Neisseriaceae bacterium]|nr:protein-L-isoaspartate O-methyltransferase [Neisseriaceae bacterium]
MNTDTYLIRRSRMVERLKSAGIRNEAVLNAMRQVPRHLFLEDIFEKHAYDDLSLPLPAGQTISQPYIVARMSELLCSTTIGFPQKVLEIGTGCGYQTAVLESIGISEIYSIERIKQLHDIARENLHNCGFY